jgi:serine/threonine-protein kinase
MSPEQSAGDRDLDGRSDLYSLGVVAYQMLCGDLPFNATNTPALLVKHLSERPAPIEQRCAGVPPDLARAVMLCLEKRPEDRFPSAQALVAALDSGNVPSLPPPRPMPTAGVTSGYASAAPDSVGAYVPTSEDMGRWSAPPVAAFRRRLAPYIAIGVVAVLLAIFNVTSGFLGIMGIWSVFMAYKYAKLWSDGYDWHDVFRQPRDRILTDVMSERVEDVQALWNSKKRTIVRERHRQRLSSPGLFSPLPLEASRPPSLSVADTAALGSGPHSATARQAITDRQEVIRLVDSLPPSERKKINDVVPTANALAEKVLVLATSLAELDRAAGAQPAVAIDKEITLLESQANPLDHAASEERVRRLAFLKRQRRTVAELGRRRDMMTSKLEECALTLQNMKFDVLRLKTGAQTWQHVTSVAEQAMALAREVDSAVYVADEMARLSPRAGAGRAVQGRP